MQDAHQENISCNITEGNPLGYLSEITPGQKDTIVANGLDYPTAIAVVVPEPSLVCFSACGLLVILLRTLGSVLSRK